MKDLIIKENNYRREMLETVEPYLAKRKTEFGVCREPGRELYCACFRAEHAAGTVLISHGFTETAEKYGEAVYYFLKNGYHVYMPEHCGHGHSYRLAEDPSLVHVDSYRRYVEDLLAVAKLAAREQPDLPLYLFGHSMGGGVAAAALAGEPNLFCRAVLSSPMIRPSTGGVPWPLAKLTASALCLLGKKKSYVPGQHAFDGKETFADSAATSLERFTFYQEKRNREPLYQMSGASCGWLREAGRLNRFLRGRAWKMIETPLLIFQAGQDTFVSAPEQDRFAALVQKTGRTTAQLVRVPEARHEIYNSPDGTIGPYWEKIFRFLDVREAADGA